MADVLTTRLDPVEGLVNYTLFTKPYHSKILEVLVEYVHIDCIDVTFTENFNISLGAPDPSLLPLWGWTEDEAKKFFNCDFQSFQISNVDVSGFFEIVGSYASTFSSGEKIVVQTDQLQFTEFTIDTVTVSTETLETSNGTGTIDTTRINVVEVVAPNFPSTGVILPQSCWVYNNSTNTYQFNGGIVWPSLPHVEKNINCGGFGTIWDSNGIGSPEVSPLGVPNAIISGDASNSYLEIDNTTGVPAAIATWFDAFQYGVKFEITGSTGNDGVYTVNTSHLVYSGSPLTVTNTLRVHVLGNLPSNTIDGSMTIVPWGYDEPTVCIDQGQSLAAEASIKEKMSITLNDNGINIVQGWDMDLFDTTGYDGGSFTYEVAFS